MAEYLYVSDKWDNYMVDNDKGVEWAALDLLRTRVEDGFWYDYPEGAQDQAAKLVQDEDAKGALAFLLNRVDHEYEYVEVKHKR